ncbi:MAG: SET domain-containing protein-lysine N-methyltransferase [Nevskia sp.]|nr:SET domain-containing protein-lysine N-methyltransferase [Nevskia sp.]
MSDTPRAAAAGSPVPAIAVRRSKVNGRGLFATADLHGRRKLGELSGELVKLLPGTWERFGRSPKIYLVQVSHRYALECSRGNAFKYLNHSCEPNCYLRVYRRRVEVYSRRDIARGTELTVDYGQTPHRQGMRCRCGSARCRGVI